MRSKVLPALVVSVAASAVVRMALAAPLAYVPINSLNTFGDNQGNTVVVVDLATLQTVGNPITVNSGPSGVAVTPDGSHAYVANRGTNPGKVSVIDTQTNTVIATVTVGPNPWGVAINSAGTHVYVTCGDTSVWDITVSNNSPALLAAAGTNPEGIVVTPDGTKVWVANNGSNTLSVITVSTKAVTPITLQSTCTSPVGITILPKGNKVYVACEGTNTVAVYNTSNNSLATTITLNGNSPYGIVASYDGDHVYVSEFIGNGVEVIDTATNSVEPAAISTAGVTFGCDVTPQNSIIVPGESLCLFPPCPPQASFLNACDPISGNCDVSALFAWGADSFGHNVTPEHVPPIPTLDSLTAEKTCLNAITNNAQTYADAVLNNFQSCFSQNATDNLLTDWTNGKGLLLADSVCWPLLDPNNSSSTSGVAYKRNSLTNTIDTNCNGLSTAQIAKIGSPCGITNFTGDANGPWKSNPLGCYPPFCTYYGIAACVLDQAAFAATQMIATQYGPSPHVCSGGTNNGLACHTAADCPGGTCVVQSDGQACQLGKSIGLDLPYPGLCQ